MDQKIMEMARLMWQLSGKFKVQRLWLLLPFHDVSGNTGAERVVDKVNTDHNKIENYL
jgi:hypothetical protein